MAAAIAVVINNEWEAAPLVRKFLKDGGVVAEMPRELVVLPDGKVLCLPCLPSKVWYAGNTDRLKEHVDVKHHQCCHTCSACANGFRSPGELGTHKNVTRH